MIPLSSKCFVFVVFTIPFVNSDVLESERSSFLGFSHEVIISRSTMELVLALADAVLASGPGDRPVRRYYQRYDTPFVGETRRNT